MPPPLTGTPEAAEPADLSEVRLNNRVRRALDAAIGGMSLQARDPDKRFESAQAVFKSRETSVLPALDAALEKETDPRIKQALTEARAAVILFSDDASEADKLGAVAVVRLRGDQDALNLLAGLPAGACVTVQRAARDAVTSMQNKLAAWATVQNAWYGLSLGSVLLLAAIGLAITFGVMGVINMAHGEMVMIGAYATSASCRNSPPPFGIAVRIRSTSIPRSACIAVLPLRPAWLVPPWSAS